MDYTHLALFVLYILGFPEFSSCLKHLKNNHKSAYDSGEGHVIKANKANYEDEGDEAGDISGTGADAGTSFEVAEIITEGDQQTIIITNQEFSEKGN